MSRRPQLADAIRTQLTDRQADRIKPASQEPRRLRGVEGDDSHAVERLTQQRIASGKTHGGGGITA